MTDGIIQEVFKKVIDGYKSKLPNAYFNEVIERTINDFELLQQELIERIKQNWREINKTHDLCLCNADIEILRMLVGDNQQ